MVYFIENKITHLKYTVSPENPVQVLECISVIRCIIRCGNVQKTIKIQKSTTKVKNR